jgi:hypothetical protein
VAIAVSISVPVSVVRLAVRLDAPVFVTVQRRCLSKLLQSAQLTT